MRERLGLWSIPQMSEICAYINSDLDIWNMSLVNLQERKHSWNSLLTIASASMCMIEGAGFLVLISFSSLLGPEIIL